MSDPGAKIIDSVEPFDSAPSERIQYLRAYQYIFENPKWYLVILIGTVANFVPVVGPMVFSGYLFEVVEFLHRKPDALYPEFDFDRLGDYLKRGVWPFLVGLIVGFVLAPIFLVLYLPFALAFIFLSNNSGGGEFMVLFLMVFFGLEVLVIFAVALLLQIVTMPMMLRAGLQQDFAAAFEFRFVWDFLKRMWPEMLLESLFLGVTGMVLMLTGYLMCLLGIYPAMVVWTMAGYHFYHQIYGLYLLRGGTPIPLKPQAPPKQPVSIPGPSPFKS